jgi:hypothetical protein
MDHDRTTVRSTPDGPLAGVDATVQQSMAVIRK